MKTYVVAMGQHVGPDGTEYKKGDKIQSASDLLKLFPNKFQLVAEVIEVPAPVKEAPAPVAEAPELTEDGRKDVTDSFKLAEKNNLKVYKNGTKLEVEDPDDEEAGILNSKIITKKATLIAFLEQYLEG